MPNVSCCPAMPLGRSMLSGVALLSVLLVVARASTAVLTLRATYPDVLVRPFVFGICLFWSNGNEQRSLDPTCLRGRSSFVTLLSSNHIDFSLPGFWHHVAVLIPGVARSRAAVLSARQQPRLQLDYRHGDDARGDQHLAALRAVFLQILRSDVRMIFFASPIPFVRIHLQRHYHLCISSHFHLA